MHKNPRPFLILEAGVPIPSMRRHGRFAHWIRTAAGLGRDEIEAVDLQAVDALPSHAGYAGVLVSGSGAMVTDREPWSERTAAWLREAAHDGAELFGICYGHQLLAHALGGEVGVNPRGIEMGTVAIDLAADAAEDPLFTGLPSRFLAQSSHVQSALRAPDGAVVLAGSAMDPVHAFRWGESAWGVQFHPEFSAMHMRGYVAARSHLLAADDQDPAALLQGVRAAPDARRVLRRFVRRARRRG